VDVVQFKIKFWHYTVPGTLWGYPFDLYFAVSLIVGIIIPLVYWQVEHLSQKLVIPFILSLPFYFLFQDYVVIKVTSNKIVFVDSPYWWVGDFFALTIITWGTLFVFHKYVRDQL